MLTWAGVQGAESAVGAQAGGRSWSLWKRTACVRTQAGTRARARYTVQVCTCRGVCVQTRAGSPHLTLSEVRDPSTRKALICAHGERLQHPRRFL